MQRQTASPKTAEHIELRDPALAAFLAWLWPGAGHLYQRRYAKGALFMSCILITFFYGMAISDGRAVYASWRPDHKRYPYLCQVATGLPALPALVEARRKETPVLREGGKAQEKASLFGGWYVPPGNQGELDELHRRYHRYLELGTVYTMIAGLLNILVIWDAWGGPAYIEEEEPSAEGDSGDGPAKEPDRPPD